MKYTFLGRTGLKVSRLCLGTMNFGPRTSEAEAHRIMDRALELGINFFDTADRYGDPQGSRQTEEIIGRWIAKSGKRDQVVLATKVFGPMGPGANDEGLSAYHIRQGCEESLRALQTDRIDLYQMHHVDRGKPHPKRDLAFLDGDIGNLYFPPHLRGGTGWEEIWQAMGQLVGSGKAVYIGTSNFAAWNVVQGNEEARRRGLLGTVSEQSKYNLITRQIELEMVPACRAYGVGILPWSPLASGALAGKARSAEGGRRSGVQRDEKTAAQIQRFEALCDRIGEEPSTVALAWLLHNPVVTAPIIGPRTVEQLETSLRALEVRLDAEVLSALDEIFPGPGDQAPEAYAW